MSKQQELINELTEKMNENIKNYKTNPKDELELLKYISQFSKYSIKNTLLIQSQYKGAWGVASYKQFKEKGYQVQKGEKALRIFAPKIQKGFIDENNQFKFLKHATKQQKEKIRNKELKVSNRTVGFIAVPVFDVTQTDCPPEDYPKLFPNRPENFEYQGTQSELKSLEQAIHQYANDTNLDIQYGKTDSSAKGYYVPAHHSIMIKDTLPKTEQVKVLLHEIAHAEMHNIGALKEKPNINTNIKEYQAEMTAYVVSNQFNLDTEDYSTRYLNAWTNRKVDDETYIKSLEEVKQVSNSLVKDIVKRFNLIEQEKGREPILDDNDIVKQETITDNHIAMKTGIFKSNEYSYYDLEKDKNIKATAIEVIPKNNYTHNIIRLESESNRSYTVGIDTPKVSTNDIKTWKQGMTGKEWLDTDLKTELIRNDKDNLTKLSFNDYENNKDIALKDIDTVIDEREREESKSSTLSR